MKVFRVIQSFFIIFIVLPFAFSIQNNDKKELTLSKNASIQTKQVNDQRAQIRTQNLKQAHKSNYLFNNLIRKNTFRFKEKSTRQRNHMYSVDYTSLSRNISFYISKSNECSVRVNDTVTYNLLTQTNLVEHMLLHNNAESIEPRGVYSDNLQINFFTFNKKLNIFEAYYANPKNNTKYAINYEYDANNLIKRNIVVNQTNDTNNNLNETKSYNSFIWKMVNQNYMKQNETFHIEIEFDLGKRFIDEKIEFSLNFTKVVDEKRAKVKYIWDGIVDSQDVVVLKVKFPLYFSKCKALKLNFGMILIGSIFIMFLIGMLYFIVSTILLEKL